MSFSPLTVAILGGTGDVGTGLAWRWARAGHSVIIGSRKREKALRAAAAAQEKVPQQEVRGLENREAAEGADVVVLTVPFEHQMSTLETVRDGLVGKILIDVTVPLMPPKVGTVQLPTEGGAAIRAQQMLGDEVRVISAFQNVGAQHLQEGHAIECDVLVAGDDPEAREVAIRLVEDAGLRGWHAGPLANAVAAEALTSVLIQINRRYKIGGAGIRITGDPPAPRSGDQ
jgi:NADPH-dependent F420 reductase